jgi:hypothetical protein
MRTLGTYSNELRLGAARKLAGKHKLAITGSGNPAVDKSEARRKAAAGIDPDQLFARHGATGKRH